MFEIKITASSMSELRQKAAELALSMGAVAPTQHSAISQGSTVAISNTKAEAPEVTFEEPATLDPGTEITEAPAQEKPAKKAAKKTAKKAEPVEAPTVSFDDSEDETPAKDPEEAPGEAGGMDEESTETAQEDADDISAPEESEPVEDKPAFDFEALTEAMGRQVTKDDVGKQVVDFSPHKATLTIQNLAKQKIVANREAVVALLENYGIKAASRINVGRYFEFIEDMRKIK